MEGVRHVKSGSLQDPLPNPRLHYKYPEYCGIYIYIYIHIYIYIPQYSEERDTHTHTLCVCVCIYVCIYMCVCVYIYIKRDYPMIITCHCIQAC